MTNFNPRPPCGGRHGQNVPRRSTVNFNPRPPCGGRPISHKMYYHIIMISIHVLRVEDDIYPIQIFLGRQYISIHVLRVEDDTKQLHNCRHSFNFNPRPPCGGRQICVMMKGWSTYFNPRPPCGGRQICVMMKGWYSYFNPRPPCGGRQGLHCLIKGKPTFQSTSSVWRTTAKTEKNLYLHSYNTAICTNLQPKHSAYAFVCTDKDKQSHEKLVRSIRVRSARFTFARPSPPGEALRKSERHPAGRRGERRRVPLCFGNGCPAGKSAGCPLPGRSVWSARP